MDLAISIVLLVMVGVYGILTVDRIDSIDWRRSIPPSVMMALLLTVLLIHHHL